LQFPLLFLGIAFTRAFLWSHIIVFVELILLSVLILLY